MKSATLLQELAAKIEQHINFVKSIQHLPQEVLTRRKSPENWNVLECLEHLNRYGDYYLPEIEKAIATSNATSEATFKSGWLGNYFANSMLPKEKLNKMKTFKDKNPLHSDLDNSVISVFLEQQIQLLELLQKANTVSLNKVKVKVSIAQWLTIKLGDTFRFVIFHNERHIKQMERILA